MSDQQTPIVLPAGAACDYINGDDGYHWLTCGTCEESMLEVAAGTLFGDLLAAVAAHTCHPAADPAAQSGGTS